MTCSSSDQDQYYHFHIGDQNRLIQMANILSDRYLKEPLEGESFMADIKSISFSRLLNGGTLIKQQLQYQSL